MEYSKVAVIGCGNLGLSIVEGLIKSESNISVIATRRNTEPIKHLTKQGITITSDNEYAIKNSKIILFVLKPYLILDIIKEYKSLFTKDHIIVSLAPGIGLDTVIEHTGGHKNVFRAMPNVAASVCESATAISSNGDNKTALNTLISIFNLVGDTILIDENLMESATIIGACGTAFALRFIRAMIQAGVQIGFKPDIAAQIANQTVKGATEILINSNNHPEVEIDKVTTPKGITITGLNEMEHQGFSASVIQGILASHRKIEGKD